jgi:hypothetical protein
MTSMEILAACIGLGILATITIGFWRATHR